MADRQQFLETIRAATARGRAYRVALNPEATADASYVGDAGDPVGTFLSEWIAVGGRGTRVTGAEAARAALQAFVREHQIRTALCWQHPVLEKLGIADALRTAQVEAHDWAALERADAAQRWSTAFSADLGITSVDWAVAETGSLALAAKSGQGRVCSLLPPVYLAIFERSQIVPDLFDLFRALEPLKEQLPSNLALVTGPSKTGDIELKLTTGVHGPGNVNVLVVE